MYAASSTVTAHVHRVLNLLVLTERADWQQATIAQERDKNQVCQFASQHVTNFQALNLLCNGSFERASHLFCSAYGTL